MKNITLFLFALLLLNACTKDEKNYDASGILEADPTIISAQASGVLQSLNIEEGDTLNAGDLIGYIDTTQIYLKKLQVKANINTILSKLPDIGAQLAALHAQLSYAQQELARVKRLRASAAATEKQVDEAQAQVDVLKKKIRAQKVRLNTQSAGLSASTEELYVRLKQIEDKLNKHYIVNPLKGTVLMTYVEQYEMVGAGAPLYKIADMTHLILRAYITGNQFAQIKLGQKVKVQVDNGSGGLRNYTGKIVWISDEAEFTPKSIQTKEERENKVYAVKVRIENDGYLKIGMYGQLQFTGNLNLGHG